MPFIAPLDRDTAFGPVAIDTLGDMMRETKSLHSGVWALIIPILRESSEGIVL